MWTYAQIASNSYYMCYYTAKRGGRCLRGMDFVIALHCHQALKRRDDIRDDMVYGV